jgi:hypothetical protein
MSAQAEDSAHTVTLSNPDHEGEALHVRIRQDDGHMIVTPLQSVEFTVTVSSTNRADLEQTEHVDFDGASYGTGVSTIGGEEARMVVAEDADGNWKGLTKFQYEVTPGDEGQK